MLKLAHGPGAALQQGILLLHGSSGSSARVHYPEAIAPHGAPRGSTGVSCTRGRRSSKAGAAFWSLGSVLAPGWHSQNPSCCCPAPPRAPGSPCKWKERGSWCQILAQKELELRCWDPGLGAWLLSPRWCRGGGASWKLLVVEKVKERPGHPQGYAATSRAGQSDFLPPPAFFKAVQIRMGKAQSAAELAEVASSGGKRLFRLDFGVIGPKRGRKLVLHHVLWSLPCIHSAPRCPSSSQEK